MFDLNYTFGLSNVNLQMCSLELLQKWSQSKWNIYIVGMDMPKFHGFHFLMENNNEKLKWLKSRVKEFFFLFLKIKHIIILLNDKLYANGKNYIG